MLGFILGKRKRTMKRGEMLGKAIVYATNKHAGQFDKGGLPYILHPFKVMHYLKTDDEEMQVIAILHDVIEDTDATWEELREFVTERVILGIDALTKRPGESYEDYKKRVMSNWDSMMVKRADLRTNSDIRRIKNREITDKDVQRVIKYHKFYLEIEEALANWQG